MKYLITTIAAVLFVGCSGFNRSVLVGRTSFPDADIQPVAFVHIAVLAIHIRKIRLRRFVRQSGLVHI